MMPASEARTPLYRVAAALCLAAFLPACESTRWKRNLVYSRSPVAVYVEREEREGKTVPHGYAHPAEIPAHALGGYLKTLRFRPRGLFKRGDEGPVFEEPEVDALAQPLADALKEVGPDERVRFLVGRTKWRPLFLGPKGTSAVVFLDAPGRLNLAFDLLQDTLPEETGDPRAMVFRGDPVTITAKTPDLLPPDGSALRGGAPEGRVHPRWIVADASRLPVPPPREEPPIPGQPAGSPGGLDAETEAIRRRLGVLDDLHRKGAISAEERDKARREILLQTER